MEDFWLCYRKQLFPSFWTDSHRNERKSKKTKGDKFGKERKELRIIRTTKEAEIQERRPEKNAHIYNFANQENTRKSLSLSL